MGEPTKVKNRNGLDHELYTYLNRYGYGNNEDLDQGYCKIGEIPLGLDESELGYYDEHADNDLDKDDK